MNKPPQKPTATVTRLQVDFKMPEERLRPGESIIGHDNLSRADEERTPSVLPHDLKEK